MNSKIITFLNISDIPIEKWKHLSEKVIYFGHQFVGFNIIDGISDVMEDNHEIKLTIVDTPNKYAFNRGTLVHSTIGNNKDQNSKINDFFNILS